MDRSSRLARRSKCIASPEDLCGAAKEPRACLFLSSWSQCTALILRNCGRYARAGVDDRIWQTGPAVSCCGANYALTMLTEVCGIEAAIHRHCNSGYPQTVIAGQEGRGSGNIFALTWFS